MTPQVRPACGRLEQAVVSQRLPSRSIDTSSKLDMALDDVAALAQPGGSRGGGRRGGGGAAVVRGGGRPPRGQGAAGAAAADGEEGPFNPYRNTGGRTHLAGASLQEIAAACDAERCACSPLPPRTPGPGSRALLADPHAAC